MGVVIAKDKMEHKSFTRLLLQIFVVATMLMISSTSGQCSSACKNRFKLYGDRSCSSLCQDLNGACEFCPDLGPEICGNCGLLGGTSDVSGCTRKCTSGVAQCKASCKK